MINIISIENKVVNVIKYYIIMRSRINVKKGFTHSLYSQM